MKNPFRKENNSTLIAAIVVAGVAAGAIAFFFLTEKGQDTRKSLKKKIKLIAKNAAVDAISKKAKIKKKTVKAVADHVAKTD
jgi:hypothetical protein